MYENLFKMDGKTVCKSCGGKAGVHKSDCSAASMKKKAKPPMDAQDSEMGEGPDNEQVEMKGKSKKPMKKQQGEARAGVRDFVRRMFMGE